MSGHIPCPSSFVALSGQGWVEKAPTLTLKATLTFTVLPSPPCRGQTEKEMLAAAKREDYDEAARLRDELLTLQSE